jgi:eukaryotic-like serine/threonine-protein kinase
MSLAPGTSIGPYEVVSPIGAGGMGEVYRATDKNLGRTVAIKILPDEFSRDSERLARFEREARTLALLNHPNIATIHGFEKNDGVRALVMEYVDGPTLADRLERGPIPLDEALPIARQIADALETAHEKGIVHRDLKPANIKIRPDGTVKVLDFGLAKALETAPHSSDASQSPTITSPAMTRVGVILGTAAYMSPEQARGRAADKRSDVWAFGCVLFEMLTGRRAFEGDDASDTLAAVLRSDPPWDALPPSLPGPIDMLLKGCLEKNPRDRISDMSIALFVLKHEPSRPLAVPTHAPAPAWKRAWPLAAIVAASATLGAAAAVGLWRHSSAPEMRVARFALPMTDGRTLTLSRRSVAVSPDGSHIAYTADGRIYIRPIAEAEARRLPGADPGILPAFSPDGQSIVFWVNAELKRISIAGGVPVSVCATTPAPFAVAWDASGIVFDRRDTGILRVSPDGGTPQPIVRLTDKDGLVQKLQLLPDGDTVLFSITRTDAWANGDIFIQSIRTGERKTIIEGGIDAHYLATGHLVYLVGGTLMTRPFNVHRKEPTGGAVPVIEGVRRSGGANYAVSDNGVLAYVPGPAQIGQDNVIVYDRKGTVTALPLPRGVYQNPRVSPDGKWLAVETHDGKETAIGLYELSGASSIRRLTYGGNNRVPVWSADGTRVAFQSDREGDRAVFWQPVDGGPAERLTRPEPGTVHTPESWAPLSDVLLFSVTKDVETTLWTFSTSSRKASRFGDVTSVGQPTDAVFSPDGRWIAYQIGESNSAEGWTYVQPFPPTGTKHQIARGGRPLWSRDGRDLALFFRSSPI